ncbi:hypothetical protein QSV08_17685 [Maribacter sp. BPC-D8]|uniref:hypothetical protein n=1 Tax=Maribacter sp. BPC-D8 TaxID=3053613 RepID=UPI002B462A8F|nr:hypothetical protein [Maribacter sp. BPC-D8]WRI29041.1 hypothetical protein QSV08_17685 [Maribacter sp. BPC-D8]
MNSKNWGYVGFENDVRNIFETIVANHCLVVAKTDSFSFVEFKNEKIGIYINYDDSKVLRFSFKKYANTFDYKQYDLAQCCVLKEIRFVEPVCDFKDEVCIKKGIYYIKELVEEYFSDELKGEFSYKEDYQLLKEENYFIKEKLLLLPIGDKLKQKIKNDYLPKAGVKEMRNRLIETHEYPEKFKAICNQYLRN